MPLHGWDLNWLGPVNKLHPINRELKLWLMGIPGLTGGPTWVDLAGPSNGNRGVLTNMDIRTVWEPSTRLGGWMALHFTPTNDRVDVSQTAGLTLSGPHTISFFFSLLLPAPQ